MSDTIKIKRIQFQVRDKLTGEIGWVNADEFVKVFMECVI